MIVRVYYGVFYSLEDDGFKLGQAFAKHGFNDLDSLIDGSGWFGNGAYGSMDILLGVKDGDEDKVESELTEFFESDEFEKLLNDEDIDEVLKKGFDFNNVTYKFIKVY